MRISYKWSFTNLDVIPQDLTMPLSSTLAKSFTTLTTTSHVASVDAGRKLICHQDLHEIISNIRSCLLAKFSIPDPSETLMHYYLMIPTFSITTTSSRGQDSGAYCGVGCPRKTLFQKNKKRNPPRISLGVSLNIFKRIFDFDQV